MDPQLAREASALSRHLQTMHVMLSHVRITECRGPATVTLDGLGAIKGLEIQGVDQTVVDCVYAALLAAQVDANRGYEKYGRTRG